MRSIRDHRNRITDIVLDGDTTWDSAEVVHDRAGNLVSDGTCY